MPDREGLCRDQRACEAVIEEALHGAGACLRDRSTGSASDGSSYARAVISPHDIEIWIYDDTVSFLGVEVDRRIAEWDFGKRGTGTCFRTWLSLLPLLWVWIWLVYVSAMP